MILDRKFDEKRTRDRPRRTWIDDIIHWMQKKKYDEVKRLAEDRDSWRKTTHQLLTQKMAYDDDDDDDEKPGTDQEQTRPRMLAFWWFTY